MAREKRQARRAVIDHFERTFDARSFDYKTLIRPAQGKSKLVGIAVAFGLYSAVFGIAWLGWSSGRVSYELFFKTTWVLLLPATALGVFAWMFAFNRFENRMRAPLVEQIARIEGEHGMLWRYLPLIQAADPANTAVKATLNASRELRGRAIDAEDYCMAVAAIRKAIRGSELKPVSADVWGEIAAALEVS